MSIICIVSDYTQWRAKIAHQQKMFAMPFVVKSHLYSWTSISRSMNSKYSIKSMRFNFWNTFFEYVFEWFYSAYSYFAKMYLYIVDIQRNLQRIHVKNAICQISPNAIINAVYFRLTFDHNSPVFMHFADLFLITFIHIYPFNLG